MINKEGKIILLGKEVSNNRGKSLEKDIIDFTNRTKTVICKGLNRRKVFVGDYLECLKSRADKNHRMQRFFPGIELIRIVKTFNLTEKQSIGNNLYSYEFKGITKKGNLVGVHIKEIYDGKDKILKLISTFGK